MRYKQFCLRMIRIIFFMCIDRKYRVIPINDKFARRADNVVMQFLCRFTGSQFSVCSDKVVSIIDINQCFHIHYPLLKKDNGMPLSFRSEERRVGKECSST